MPLNCQVFVNPSSTPAEQPVSVFLTITNPGAATIAITGGDLEVTQLGNGSDVSCARPLLPLGPGMQTVINPGATVLAGPVMIVLHSPSASNSYQTVSPTGAPAVDVQPSGSRGGATGNHYPEFTVLVGATVYGSDGSVNVAGKAPILVDVVAPPPVGLQGGFLDLARGSNLANYLAGVL